MQKLGKEMRDYVTAYTTETDENNMIKKPGAINGGFFPKKLDWPAQYPSVVIAVDNIKEAMKKVTDAGGKVLGEPMEIPRIGKYVSFTDTEGNHVSMLQPIYEIVVGILWEVAPVYHLTSKHGRGSRPPHKIGLPHGDFL